MRRFGLVVVALALAAGGVQAADFEALDAGPLHEAFVTKAHGAMVLQATEQAPPARLKEQVGPPCDGDTDWIPGYWAWSDDNDDFIWVSGVWRRPPPGHRWIQGFWKEMDGAWVWIPGLWSVGPESELVLIDQRPPDAPQVEAPAAPEGKAFWMPGYWGPRNERQTFEWYSGKWEPVEQEWVFVPSHWLWRPGGYLFVSSYWDYPLQERGCIYPAIKVGPEAKGKDYQVDKPLEPSEIVESLLPNYPDYATFFQQHYLTHPTFWERYVDTPPWWAWSSWWAQNWSDQWAVFWWWTHPGYPQPAWITITTSTRIWPPPSGLIRKMAKATPPFIVTPEGVVSPDHVLKEAARITEQRVDEMPPVLPAKPKIRETIEKASEPRMREGVRPLRPSGRPPGPGEEVQLPGPVIKMKIETPPDSLKVHPPRVPPMPNKEVKHPLRKQEPLTKPATGQKMEQPGNNTPTPKASEPPKRPRAAPASGSGDAQAEPLHTTPSKAEPTLRGTQTPDLRKRPERTMQPPSATGRGEGPASPTSAHLRHRGGRQVGHGSISPKHPSRHGRTAMRKQFGHRRKAGRALMIHMTPPQTASEAMAVQTNSAQDCLAEQSRTKRTESVEASARKLSRIAALRETANRGQNTSDLAMAPRVAAQPLVLSGKQIETAEPVAQAARPKRPERRPDCPRPNTPRRGRGGRRMQAAGVGGVAPKGRAGRWARASVEPRANARPGR